MEHYSINVWHIDVRFMSGNGKGFNVVRDLKHFIAAILAIDKDFCLLPLEEAKAKTFVSQQKNQTRRKVLKILPSQSCGQQCCWEHQDSNQVLDLTIETSMIIIIIPPILEPRKIQHKQCTSRSRRWSDNGMVLEVTSSVWLPRRDEISSQTDDG
jgi:hypothetical protein